MFANIQINGKPSDLARTNGFNLYDVKKWRTLFPYENPFQNKPHNGRNRRRSLSPKAATNGINKIKQVLSSLDSSKHFGEEAQKVVVKWGSTQKHVLDYGIPVDSDECIDIAQRIQDRLRDAITEWRTDGRDGRDHRAYPVFAPDLRAKALLKDLERRKCGYLMASSSSSSPSSSSSQSLPSVHQHQLVDLAADSGQRSLHGVALNFPFTDMITIEVQREKIYSTHSYIIFIYHILCVYVYRSA